MNKIFGDDGPMDTICKSMDLPLLSIRDTNVLLDKLKTQEELREFCEKCLTNHSVAFMKYLYKLAEIELPEELLDIKY